MGGPALGLAIGGMVLWSGIGILRESSHILLEGLPRNIQLEAVARALLRVEGIQEVHDIHIWTLGTDLNALSCHIRIPDMHMEESEKVLTQVREVLASEFQISHTTIQFERAGLPPTPASTCLNPCSAGRLGQRKRLRIETDLVIGGKNEVGVIPSAAKDLLFAENRKKPYPSGQPRPRNNSSVNVSRLGS